MNFNAVPQAYILTIWTNSALIETYLTLLQGKFAILNYLYFITNVHSIVAYVSFESWFLLVQINLLCIHLHWKYFHLSWPDPGRDSNLTCSKKNWASSKKLKPFRTRPVRKGTEEVQFGWTWTGGSSTKRDTWTEIWGDGRRCSGPGCVRNVCNKILW